MQEKRIMVCLDGSKNSLRGLRTAILFARQADATIVGVYSDSSHSASTAAHTPKIKKEKWSNDAREVIKTAKEKAQKRGVKFEGVVLAGNAAGYDLVTFANNPKNKIEQIVIGSRGLGSPREIILGSTSYTILHKAKVPVTITK